MEDFMKLFEYFKTPFMDGEGDKGGAATTTTTTVIPEGTQANTGAADQIPDGNKPDAAWAEMRRKAKLADDLLKENEGYKSKFEKISKKALPEGYTTVDEYLEYLDGLDEVPFTPEKPEKPVIDEKKIIDAVMGKISEHPIIKSVQKERQDRFLVNSFQEVQKAFPDIKEPKDIPVEVWNAWDEGKSKRTLVSHLKEHRYDSDIEAAKKAGANQEKATVMSTAHTAKVNGSTTASEYDNVIVPDSVKKQLESQGIKDPMKQKYYYAKYHRTE
jgi:hypothetical protein